MTTDNQMANIDCDFLPFGLDEDLFPETVAQNAPLARHRTNQEVKADCCPAVRPQECFKEAESHERHHVDVRPHGESCLHGLLSRKVINREVFIILGVRDGLPSLVLSEKHVQNDDSRLHK